MRKQLLALRCSPPHSRLSLLVGPPHLAGLSSAETEVRILSRQPPSFGPEKLA